MESLELKIEKSINLLKKAEKLALLMQPEFGFYLAFSGGKDSQVVYTLAKMAGVRFKAVYNVTTNDPAENVRFIKQVYPDVIFDVPVQSYFRMIEKKGLPTMLNRWCCAVFKESKGKNCVVLTGVRAEESRKRSEYSEFMKSAKRKTSRGARNLDEMAENSFRCVRGTDKFVLHPILKWTVADVMAFHARYLLPQNPCYSTATRVGCVFCPFQSGKRLLKYEKSHPKQVQALLHSIQKYLDRGGDNGKFRDAADLYMWWLSKKSIKEYRESKKQLDLFQLGEN